MRMWMGKSLLVESILFVSIWCFPFVWPYTRRCSDCPTIPCRRESKCSSWKQLAACKSPAGWEYCSCGEIEIENINATCLSPSALDMDRKQLEAQRERVEEEHGMASGLLLLRVTLTTRLTALRIGRQSNIKLPYIAARRCSLHHVPFPRPNNNEVISLSRTRSPLALDGDFRDRDAREEEKGSYLQACLPG